MNDFAAWSQHVKSLDAALARLLPLAESLGVASPRGEEWFALLEQKLLPQIVGEPWLVVAIVGGTNIGKSLVFNQLAGEEASAVSPLAAGTRHPVCLTPQGFAEPATLSRLFPGFELRPWRSPDDALDQGGTHLLFWRESCSVPPRLLLLDTPDIDSDAQVNWERADHIRQAADVLVAVITQQKYNDAAVKQFFRKAAEADKPVIVLFNQCDMIEDRRYWPLWLDTFVGETGVDAMLVYVAPRDSAAAKALALPFFSVGRDGQSEANQSSPLREELAALRFDELKLRTLRGAMAKVLEAESGTPSFLAGVKATADKFAQAVSALEGIMARVNWPSLPPAVLSDELWRWWDGRRDKVTRRIHAGYRTVLARPARWLWSKVAGTATDPLAGFHERERVAVMEAFDQYITELDRLAEVGNDVLRPRLAACLQGKSRESALTQIQDDYAQLPAVDDEFREFVSERLDVWAKNNPTSHQLIRWADQFLALARPVVSVAFGFGGGEVAAHATATVVADAAVGGAVGVVVGDIAMNAGASKGAEKLAFRTVLQEIHHGFYCRRLAWLKTALRDRIIGDLLNQLQAGAELPRHEAFIACQREVEALRAATTRSSNLPAATAPG